MKSNLLRHAFLFAILSLMILPPPAHAAENVVDAIEIVRTIHQADREALVTEVLQLTEGESSSFWPLYRSYREDVEKLGDGLIKLVLEYADAYPDVPEARARQLLKDYMTLEEKLVSKRAWYLKRAAKFLPATKVLRWAQLENRMDLGLRLQLAGSIPLVPGSSDSPGKP